MVIITRTLCKKGPFVIWEIVLPFQTFVVVVAVRKEKVLVQFSQAHAIS